MADKVVQVPGIGNVAFPDTMSDDQISGAIRKQLAAQGTPAEADKGWFSKMVDAVSSFGGGMNETANPVSGKALAANEQMVKHPVETAKGMLSAQGGLAAEAGESFQQGDYLTGVRHAIAYLLPVIGPAIDKAGNDAQAGNVAQGMGEATGIGVPLALGARPTPAPSTAAVSPLASRIYQRALGVRKNTAPAIAREMGNTGVAAELPITEAGAQKLSGLIQQLQQKTEAEVSAGAKAGMTVDPNAAAAEVSKVTPRFNTVTAGRSSKGAARVQQDFLAEAGAKPEQPGTPPVPSGLYDAQGKPIMTPGKPGTAAQPAPPMSIADAQAKKVNTYQEIARRAQFGEAGTSEVEAMKGIAHNLMDQIAQKLPEVGALNDKQTTFLQLKPAFENAVAKAANGTSGFKELLVTEVAGHVTGVPGMGLAAGVMSKVLRDPALRSKLAIAINRAQQNDPARWGAPSMKSATAKVNAYANAVDQMSQSAPQSNSGQP